jgi:hypothetical protein
VLVVRSKVLLSDDTPVSARRHLSGAGGGQLGRLQLDI